MGAAGSGDVSLEAAGIADWPSAWPVPPRPWAFGHPLEEMATRQERSREHRLARQDWGDPGKNHRTLNRWND